VPTNLLNEANYLSRVGPSGKTPGQVIVKDGTFESFRIAAGYLDRILRGAEINELPVQFPTKLELAINLF
jgi:hypothetical protein